VRVHLESLPFRRPRRSRFANVVLAVAFCGAAVGAYQVYMAKCAQDQTVYEARRAYARYAAFTFAREAEDAWEDVLRAAFRGVAQPSGEPAPLSAVARGLRQAPAAPPVLFTFRIDARHRVLAAACDSAPSRATREWVAAEIARHGVRTTTSRAPS